jgi:hypothetical protein
VINFFDHKAKLARPPWQCLAPRSDISRLSRTRFQFGVEEIHDAGLTAEA